jgi:CubicO group peptidase (beta-lactamase class C family)
MLEIIELLTHYFVTLIKLLKPGVFPHLMKLANSISRARVLLLATIVGVFIATTCLAAEVPENVKEMVRSRVDGGKTMSMVIGVVDGKGISYFSYGKMAMSGNETPDESSVYEIGSISKVFTATLLAVAVRLGEVKYGDAIERYLPDGISVPTENGHSITLEQLSTQTSGLPRMPDNFKPSDVANPYADYTPELLYEFLAQAELERGIGEGYGYSNVGVGLLGHLLSRAAGISYEDLVVKRISTVLGMPDTAITFSDEMLTRLALGHQGSIEVKNWDLDALAGAGAIRSNVRDMIVFLKANMGLTETPLLASLQETHQSRVNVAPSLDIGLGWHIRKKQDTQNIHWHNGGTGGYRAFTGFTMDPLLGVVVLTNSGGGGDDDIGFHLLDPSTEMTYERLEVKVKKSILKRYVGKYQLTPDLILDIKLKKRQLMVQLTGQQRFPIYPESETKFFYKVANAQLLFESDEKGYTTGLVLHQNGRDSKAVKIK